MFLRSASPKSPGGKSCKHRFRRTGLRRGREGLARSADSEAGLGPDRRRSQAPARTPARNKAAREYYLLYVSSPLSKGTMSPSPLTANVNTLHIGRKTRSIRKDCGHGQILPMQTNARSQSYCQHQAPFRYSRAKGRMTSSRLAQTLGNQRRCGLPKWAKVK